VRAVSIRSRRSESYEVGAGGEAVAPGAVALDELLAVAVAEGALEALAELAVALAVLDVAPPTGRMPRMWKRPRLTCPPFIGQVIVKLPSLPHKPHRFRRLSEAGSVFLSAPLFPSSR